MNIDELKNIWQNSDQLKPGNTMAILNEVTNQKVFKSIWEFRFNNIFELVVNLVFAPFFIGFMIDHIDKPAFWVPAFILVMFSLYSIYTAVMKIKLYRQLQHKDHILEYQKILSRIKLIEKRSLRSLYWIIPLLSGPFVIVFTKAFMGWDVYEHTTWLVAQGIGSIIIAINIVYILKKFPNKEMEESIEFLSEIKGFNQ